MLTAHSGIDKISFTGSTATGKKVMASRGGSETAHTRTRRQRPAIVMPDVMSPTWRPSFSGRFRQFRPTLSGTKRLYVHEQIYEKLTLAIVDYARTVVVATARVRCGPRSGAERGAISPRAEPDCGRAPGRSANSCLKATRRADQATSCRHHYR